MFGVAATLGQARDRDIEEATQAVKETLQEFDDRFFTPSAERRQRLIEKVRAGEIDQDELPMDVLTVLLKDEDELNLVRDMVVRETAFYFLAGAHTSVHSLGHAVHHLLSWIETNPGSRSELVADRAMVQRFVHESFRLHPSSPVSKRRCLSDVELPDGRTALADDIVIVNLRQANRDLTIFGLDAPEFNPAREILGGVPETGITFGIGTHACLGKNLAAGNLARQGSLPSESHQYGTVASIAHALLQAGVQKHLEDAPELDQTIDRETWLRYPVCFSG
jgi:cytochrome P450